MRGELDWIVMKALDKDRSRRYETANGLARDVERYLADELVEARPPSTGYRLRKFARKNRAALAATAAIGAALAAGVVGASFGWIEARRQAAIARAESLDKQNALVAEAARAEGERLAKQEAEKRRLEAESSQKEAVAKRKEAEAARGEAEATVKFFEQNVFAAARPKGEQGGLGKDVTLREAITASQAALMSQFSSQPSTEARLRLSLGWTFMQLGEPLPASHQFEAAGAILTRLRGPDDPAALTALESLSDAYARLGRTTDALKIRIKTHAARSNLLRPDDPTLLYSKHSLASRLSNTGRQDDAIALFRECLEARKRILPADHPIVITAAWSLAQALMFAQKHKEAAVLLEETLPARRRISGKDDTDLLMHLALTGRCHAALGRYAEAEGELQEALDGQDRVLPNDHAHRITTMASLAECLWATGRKSESVALREQALTAAERGLPVDHLKTIWLRDGLAASYFALARHADAAKLLERNLAARPPGAPLDGKSEASTMRRLSAMYDAMNRGEDAKSMRDKAAVAAALPPASPAPEPAPSAETLKFKDDLLFAYLRSGRPAEALKYAEETLELRRKTLAPADPELLKNSRHVAQCLSALKQYDRAAKLLEETVKAWRTSGSFNHERLACIRELSYVHGTLGKPAAALDLL
ncbi:MAG TPA: tetratricopeptide repeat protein, partial [Planctomycetia bacterium]|nr:tetratricopeptide repeat protein [Planctomycetia bacterium]